MNANARDIGNAMRAVEFAITDAGYEHTTPIEDVIRDQKRRINELASGISNLAVPANFSKTLAQALRAQATKGTEEYDPDRPQDLFEGMAHAAIQSLVEQGAYSPIPTRLHPDQVEWVVNSLGELGVKIGNQFFFLYKGESIQYSTNESDYHYRPVGKREFGEVCTPINYDDPWKSGTVSRDDSDLWKPLPMAP